MKTFLSRFSWYRRTQDFRFPLHPHYCWGFPGAKGFIYFSDYLKIRIYSISAKLFGKVRKIRDFSLAFFGGSAPGSKSIHLDLARPIPQHIGPIDESIGFFRNYPLLLPSPV